MQIPRGTLDYAYSASTGQLTAITAPGSEGLAFGYDGVLPISETWSGTVSGTVGFGYDADLRLSGLAVDGDTIAYGYDADGLLTQAGDLSLVRDSLNGLLSETALDSVTTRTSYAFGRLETVTQDSVAFASYTYDADGNRLSRTSSAGTERGVTTPWVVRIQDRRGKIVLRVSGLRVMIRGRRCRPDPAGGPRPAWHE